MHNTVVLERPKNGSLNGVAVVTDKGEDMDTDQIMTLLMQMQIDDARRDERQRSIIENQQVITASLDKLLVFKDARVKEVDDAMAEIRKRNSEFERRLLIIEGSGLSAWTGKKVIQWASLITAIGTILGMVAGGIFWLVTHLKF